MNLLQAVDPYVGKYYSMDWAKRNILRMDKDEIKEIDKQIAKEQKQLLNIANQQGEVQLAMQQPMMDAQQEQQQQMQQQDAQQQADNAGEQEVVDNQDSQQKKSKPAKSTSWPN
jgi:hypothetical protein